MTPNLYCSARADHVSVSGDRLWRRVAECRRCQRMHTRIMLIIGLSVACAGCGSSPVKRAPGPRDFTMQDVQKFVTPGRPVVEITNRFGLPLYTKTNQFDQVVMRFRSGLPETRGAKKVVIAGEPGYVFAGFLLWSTNGSAMR